MYSPIQKINHKKWFRCRVLRDFGHGALEPIGFQCFYLVPVMAAARGFLVRRLCHPRRIGELIRPMHP